MDYTITNRLKRSDLMPVFSKLFGMLVVLFLVGVTSCSKDDPIEDSDLAPVVEPLNLKGVGVDMEADIITGTTTAMEYSLNSTNGVDGNWTTAGDGNTAVTFVEGKVFVREAGNPDNVRMVVAFGPGMVILADLDAVDINIAEGHITGMNIKIEYSLNSTNGTDGDWTLGSEQNTAVEFVAGYVYVREAKDRSNFRLVATIAPTAAAPVLVGDDNANIIIGLTDIYEYKIGDGEWTDGTEAPDLTGNKSVQVRSKATVTELASEIQTIVFTPGMYEDFEGTLTLPERGWEGGSYMNFSANHRLDTHPTAGGTQSLRVAISGNMSKVFEPIENAVVEWKVNVGATAAAGSSVPAVSLLMDQDVDGEVKPVAVAAFLLASRAFYTYHKSSAISDGGAPSGTATDIRALVFNAASNNITVDEWATFRIEFTGDRYKIYVNGTRVGTESYQTMDDGASTKINRIRFRNALAANVHYIDDIKITAQ